MKFLLILYEPPDPIVKLHVSVVVLFLMVQPHYFSRAPVLQNYSVKEEFYRSAGTILIYLHVKEKWNTGAEELLTKVVNRVKIHCYPCVCVCVTVFTVS